MDAPGMGYLGMAPEVAPPAGFHSVTPRMVVNDVPAEVEFLRFVFDAAGEVHADRPAEIRIGDSLVMVTSAREREPFPAFLYIYVEDADSSYRRALGAGAVSIEEPLDTPYGDRRGMVRDPSGNVFQIAHRMAVGD
jgi:PhnB protein